MLAFLTYLGAAILILAGAILAARHFFALPPRTGEHTLHFPPAEDGPLAEALRGRTAEHGGQTGVVPLQNGADAFAARMILAEAAVSSIDAQYYIWHADMTGLLLLDALKRAAERGARIRLLLDDNGTTGLDREIAELDALPNAEVRIYNPFTLRRFKLLAYGFDFMRLNRRMHNKSFTVDNHVTIVGGRNIGDEYFGTGPTALFVDLDVLAAGEAVTHVSDDFDLYWNCPSVYPAASIVSPPVQDSAIAAGLARHKGQPQMEEYREIVEKSPIVVKLLEGTLGLEWTTAVLVSDDPAKGQGDVRRGELLVVRLMQAVGDVRKQLDGVTPYFVPGLQGVKALKALERSGVRVRMLTNSLEATDVLPVHAGYAKRRRAMLKAGIRLFELRRQSAPSTPRDVHGLLGSSGASLHAKTFAVDGKRIFVGSFNFDPRSISLNTEMGLLIESAELAGGLHKIFDEELGLMAWEVKRTKGGLIWTNPDDPDDTPRTDEPGGSVLRNAAIMVVGWLPVEWLL